MLCWPEFRHVCSTNPGATMNSDRIQTMTLTLWRRQSSMQETCSKSCQNSFLTQHGPSIQLGIHWEGSWQMLSKFSLMMSSKSKAANQHLLHISHTFARQIGTQSNHRRRYSQVPTTLVCSLHLAHISNHPHAHLGGLLVYYFSLHIVSYTCALMASGISFRVLGFK